MPDAGHTDHHAATPSRAGLPAVRDPPDQKLCWGACEARRYRKKSQRTPCITASRVSTPLDLRSALHSPSQGSACFDACVAHSSDLAPSGTPSALLESGACGACGHSVSQSPSGREIWKPPRRALVGCRLNATRGDPADSTSPPSWSSCPVFAVSEEAKAVKGQRSHDTHGANWA